MHLSRTLRQALPEPLKPITLVSPPALSAQYIRPLRPIHATQTAPASPSSSSHSASGPTPLQGRALANNVVHSPQISPDDFQLYPNFFSLAHTRQLLSMSLAKLDGVDSVVKRRKRLMRQGKAVGAVEVGEGVLQELFDQEYDFQEGHYDSVIHHYRESLLSTFSPLTSSSPWPDYKSLMARIYALLPAHPVPSAHASPATSPASQDETAAFPPSGSTTHVLHLAPHGEIQAHVDNVDASGSVIIGVSLGSARILRLREKSGTKGGAGEGAGWDVLLPNGSLYLQRDAVRYKYEHSILSYDDPNSHWGGRPLQRGHRLSLMVRDRALQPTR